MVDAGVSGGWTAISLVRDQLLGMGFSERDVAKCSAAGCPDVESALALLQLESDDTVLSDETAPQRSLHGAESELLTFRAGEAVCVRDILGRQTQAFVVSGDICQNDSSWSNRNDLSPLIEIQFTDERNPPEFRGPRARAVEGGESFSDEFAANADCFVGMRLDARFRGDNDKFEWYSGAVVGVHQGFERPWKVTVRFDDGDIKHWNLGIKNFRVLKLPNALVPRHSIQRMTPVVGHIGSQYAHKSRQRCAAIDTEVPRTNIARSAAATARVDGVSNAIAPTSTVVATQLRPVPTLPTVGTKMRPATGPTIEPTTGHRGITGSVATQAEHSAANMTVSLSTPAAEKAQMASAASRSSPMPPRRTVQSVSRRWAAITMVCGLDMRVRADCDLRDKVSTICAAYSHWRRIRGDGNCYYRAVGFLLFERLFGPPLPPPAWNVYAAGAATAWARPSVKQLNTETAALLLTLEGVQNSFDSGSAEHAAHAELLQHIRSAADIALRQRQFCHAESKHSNECVEPWLAATGETLYDSFVREINDGDDRSKACIDLAVVRALRAVVSQFLRKHKAEPTPGGLTWEQQVSATESESTMEKFCEEVVEPLGVEAEGVILLALPLALQKWPLRLIYLDHDPHNRLEQDFPDDGEPRKLHVLLRPGHYDALYAKSLGLPPGPEAGAMLGYQLGVAADLVDVKNLFSELEFKMARVPRSMGAASIKEGAFRAGARSEGLFNLLNGGPAYTFPTITHLLSVLPRTRAFVLQLAELTAPLAHKDTCVLMSEHVRNTLTCGTLVARSVYKHMVRGTVSGGSMDIEVRNYSSLLISRLLRKRALWFDPSTERYLLRDGVSAGRGGFEDVGTADEEQLRTQQFEGQLTGRTSKHVLQHAGHGMHSVLTYREMQLGALVLLATPTMFVNDGSRRSNGDRGDTGLYEEAGVTVAVAPLRLLLSRPHLLDGEHMLITPLCDTHAGYGARALEVHGEADGADIVRGGGASSASRWLAPWAMFYGEYESNRAGCKRAYFPSYDEARAHKVSCDTADRCGSKQRTRFVAFHANDHLTGARETWYLNMDVVRRRLRVVIEPLLLDANERAYERLCPAYVDVSSFVRSCCDNKEISVPIISAGATQDTLATVVLRVLLDTFAEVLRAFRFEYIADLDFGRPETAVAVPLQLHCGGIRDGEPFRERQNYVEIHFSCRFPASPLHKQRTLVYAYACDANASPGSEFWIGALSGDRLMLEQSDSSALAASSFTHELAAPEINPRVCGACTKWLPRPGVASAICNAGVDSNILSQVPPGAEPNATACTAVKAKHEQTPAVTVPMAVAATRPTSAPALADGMYQIECVANNYPLRVQDKSESARRASREVFCLLCEQTTANERQYAEYFFRLQFDKESDCYRIFACDANTEVQWWGSTVFFDPRNYSGCVRVSSQPLKARNDALAQWRLIPGDSGPRNDGRFTDGTGAFLVGNSGDGLDKFLDALMPGRVRCAEMIGSPDMAYRLWRFRPAMCSSDGTRFNGFHCDAAGAPWQ